VIFGQWFEQSRRFKARGPVPQGAQPRRYQVLARVARQLEGHKHSFKCSRQCSTKAFVLSSTKKQPAQKKRHENYGARFTTGRGFTSALENLVANEIDH
jgi:hypothetical protein